jgi:rsbT antagonist protein RsbS
MERVPILKVGDLLLVTIQGDVDDRLAMTLQEDLMTKVSATAAQGVLIDISAVTIVDSFMGRILSNIASMTRVLGAETVVVGMQPAVAITLVELGMTLAGVQTALNVEKGMSLLGACVKPDQDGIDAQGRKERNSEGDQVERRGEGETARPRPG